MQCCTGVQHEEPTLWYSNSNDYQPCGDESRETEQVSAPFTDPPTVPSSTDSESKDLPPYPGHQYYDRLIADNPAKSVAKLSQSDMTAIALNLLADTGFTRSRDYRKKPNKTLNWVIRHNTELLYIEKIVEILLDCGGNVDIATFWPCSLMLIATETENLALMQLLLERKANVDIWVSNLGISHLTPLHVACRSGKALSIRMLLRAGANINDQSVYNEGEKRLHTAVKDQERYGWLIPMLLVHEALTELRDCRGHTPLHNAARLNRFHAARALLESGADTEATTAKGDNPLNIDLRVGSREVALVLLTHGADVHCTCSDAPCAIYKAVQHGNDEIARLLLENYSAGEDVNKRGIHNCSILHMLAGSSISDSKLYDMLLAYSFNIDAPNDYGGTPLHWAATKGNVLLLTKLIEKGAMTQLRNHKGLSPLDIAKETRHWQVIELLGRMRKSKIWWRK